MKPTQYPSHALLTQPTNYPTYYPSNFPTPHPSHYPTAKPTEYPTYSPSPNPTPQPTHFPSTQPTNYPTQPGEGPAPEGPGQEGPGGEGPNTTPQTTQTWFCVANINRKTVTGPFTTINAAKTELNKLGGGPHNRQMICEMSKSGAKQDPHIVGGQNQGGGARAGFQKWWYGWGDIN